MSAISSMGSAALSQYLHQLQGTTQQGSQKVNDHDADDASSSSSSNSVASLSHGNDSDGDADGSTAAPGQSLGGLVDTAA